MEQVPERSYLTLLAEFNNLGCSRQGKCAVACQVYHNLLQNKNNTELEKIYNAEMDVIYIRCKRREKSFIYYPILSTEKLDLSKVDDFHNYLKSIPDYSKVSLAICDNSSNVLYYPSMQGISEKTDQTSKKKRRLQYRKQRLENKRKKLAENK